MSQTPSTPTSRSASRPTLVIVCGLPATGKSTIVSELRTQLSWPTFAKDSIKELLFDSSGLAPTEATRALSTRFGQQAIALLFQTAREVLSSGTSCIIEANFLPDLAQQDLQPFLAIAELRQVHCSIPDDLVIERYKERSQAGERHPIHADDDALEDLVQRIRDGGGRPLPLDAPLLQVDATDGYNPGVGEIVEFCRT
jgi:predicted kinase